MDCTDIKVVLSGLVDGTLDATPRHEAERHLTGCAPCRALLEEAEALDQLVAEDVALLEPGALPDSFENAVLSRTVYTKPQPYASRWSTWTGWIAAAACLGLAVTIWVNDRAQWINAQPVTSGDTPTEITSRADYRPLGRSATYDGPLNTPRRSGATINLATFDPTISMTPTQASRTIGLDADTELDDLALGSAAMVLETLLEVESTDTQTIDTLRQITLYDDLVTRLKSVRSALPFADQNDVQQALLVLQQIASDDDLTAEDIAMSRRLIAEHGLVGALDRLVARIGPSGA